MKRVNYTITVTVPVMLEPFVPILAFSMGIGIGIKRLYNLLT